MEIGTTKQKIILLENHDISSIHDLACYVIYDKKDQGFIQFPRTVMIEDEKFIIFRYSVEKDVMFYRKADFDPMIKTA